MRCVHKIHHQLNSCGEKRKRKEGKHSVVGVSAGSISKHSLHKNIEQLILKKGSISMLKNLN